MVKIITERVKEKLENHPTLRENDMYLLASIWYQELKEHGLTPEKHMSFFTLLKEGKLTNPESIRRSRQKIQEENPNLRGDNYKERQNHQEEIKDQLGY